MTRLATVSMFRRDNVAVYVSSDSYPSKVIVGGKGWKSGLAIGTALLVCKE